MHITLIRSPELVSSHSNALTTPPVGVASLAAFLRKNGPYTVQVIDALGEGVQQYSELEDFPERKNLFLHGLKLEQVVERIEKQAQMVGVSCMFSQDWPLNRVLIQKIRKRFPSAVIVAGGEHISAVPEFVMQDCPEIDYCVAGEGEMPLLSLVQMIAENTSHGKESIPGLYYRESGRVLKSSAKSARIQELDSLPWPAWDLVPMENYLASGASFGINKGRNMPIIATRGCPYACTFCSNPQMWQPKWMARDPKLVVDEMEFYAKEYRANNFDFYDLTAIVRKDWIMEFCAEIEKRNLKITYQLPSGTRSEAIDEEVCAALQRTGCCHITYAPESGSQRTLKMVNKKIKLENLFASMRSAVKQKVFIKMNIVLGFPHETYSDILHTFWFLARCAWIGVHDAFVYTFSPYPGSQLFAELRAKGRIPRLDDDYFFSLATYIQLDKSISYTDHISSRKLNHCRVAGLLFFYSLSFLFHPMRVWKILRGLRRETSDTRIEAFVKSSLQNSATRGLVFFRSKKA